MAIGSSINLSIPTAGTTAKTVTKMSNGEFTVYVTPVAGYPAVPVSLKLRTNAASARPGVTMSLGLGYKPRSVEDVAHPSLGQLSLSCTVTAKLGTIVTADLLADHIAYLGSVLSNASVIDTMVQGSVE